jgi:ABC-type branched-subunit amino acid transport system substrate-binding protein
MLRGRLSVTVGVVVLATLGCSTTARHRQSQSVAAANNGVSVAPNDAGAAAAPAGSAGSFTATANLGATQPAVGGERGSAQSPRTIGAGVVLPAKGPGVNDREIDVGFVIYKDLGATYTAVGVKGVVAPAEKDTRNFVTTLLDDINARGGLGGRRLVPLFYSIDISQGTYASQAQATCSYFTEDHHVFAVFMLYNEIDPSLPACMAKSETIFIDVSNGVAFDNADLQVYAPYVYTPFRVSLTRFGGVIDEFVAGGFFDRSSKVGLLRFDLPQQQRAEAQVIVPALATHGVKLTDTYVYSYLKQTSDLSSIAAQSNNAILKFRSEGIDHVIFLASQGTVPFTFMPAAESQGYRPRYAITSEDLPMFLASNVPSAQLSGAVGVGWDRTGDVPLAAYPGVPAWSSCRRIADKAGLPETTWSFGCDPVYLLQTALEHSASVSAAGVRSALTEVGTAVPVSVTFSVAFPQRYDGPALVRLLNFNGGCKCFAYVTTERSLP